MLRERLAPEHSDGVLSVPTYKASHNRRRNLSFDSQFLSVSVPRIVYLVFLFAIGTLGKYFNLLKVDYTIIAPTEASLLGIDISSPVLASIKTEHTNNERSRY